MSIKKELKKRGYTLLSFCKKIGKDERYVTKCSQNKKNLSLKLYYLLWLFTEGNITPEGFLKPEDIEWVKEKLQEVKSGKAKE